MRSRVFGMVSLRASLAYTERALSSFFESTTLEGDDRFILIDNDRSLEDRAQSYPRCEVVVPETPRSFAQNINFAIQEAARAEADLFFLNNDLMFVKGWLEPLCVDEPLILSPFSNREIHLSWGGLSLSNTMSLDDIVDRELDLQLLAGSLTRRSWGLNKVITFAYYCVKIPHAAYTTIGLFDEGFGRGGAEDGDYSIRAHLAGFGLAYVRNSFVIHFNGKSTWCGGESAEDSQERCEKFRRVFLEKWGEALTALFVSYDNSVVAKHGDVHQLFQEGRLIEAVRLLVERTAPNRADQFG